MPWTPFARRALAAGLGLALTACGGTTGGDRPETSPRLLLDAQPEGVHAGIYLARAREFDSAEGVRLRIRRPRRTTDPVRQLETGRIDLAVLDIDDLGLAREQGHDLVGVMALVQRPLAAVLAAPAVRTPGDLVGRRVGVGARRHDAAVLRSVLTGGGVDPGRVRRIRLAPGARAAAAALTAGRLDAVTGSRAGPEAVLRVRGRPVRALGVEAFGAPVHPELVLVATRDTLTDRRDEIRAVIRGLQRGYGEAQRDPESAVSAMVEAEPRLDRATLAAQLDAVSPAFSAGAPAYGVLDPARLRAWAGWAVRFGALRRRPDLRRGFDTTLVGPTADA
jgi:putative hydroxymethylpyrimidine transport system substrate-binding protein